jgi:hypothetical protein
VTGQVIIGPDHGPSVDVEQGAAGARGTQCGPLLESAAVCPECERGKQRTPRGSNPRRPAPEEQGMPALTSRLWLAYRHIHADTYIYLHFILSHFGRVLCGNTCLYTLILTQYKQIHSDTCTYPLHYETNTRVDSLIIMASW